MLARLSAEESYDGQHCAAADLEYPGPTQPAELVQPAPRIHAGWVLPARDGITMLIAFSACHRTVAAEQQPRPHNSYLQCDGNSMCCSGFPSG